MYGNKLRLSFYGNYLRTRNGMVPSTALQLDTTNSTGWLSIAKSEAVQTEPDPILGGFYTMPIKANAINWSLLRGWLHMCETEHQETCAVLQADDLQLRGFQVIDCESRQIVPAPPGCKYAALSYVWGSSTGAVTLFQPFLPTQAPQVVEDALICTRAIGLRYLWIDSTECPCTNCM
jgi:hypothetical protein